MLAKAIKLGSCEEGTWTYFLGNQDESSPTESITIEEHPTSQKQKEGSKVEFKCKAQGRREVSYQWLKDRTEIQGQNSPILSLDHVKLCDFGSYTCEVRSTDGQCVESSPAMLDVSPGDGMSKFIISVVTSVQHPKCMCHCIMLPHHYYVTTFP